MPGIRVDLDRAKNQDEEVVEVDMDPEAWKSREMVWRFLKRYTSGEAKKVVCSAPNRNSWEAWRKLHLQYEPALVMREAVVMAAFTDMVAKRAKKPSESKALLTELDERAKRVEEVTGEPIDNRHRMSVIMGVIDSESMKHTSAFQGAKQRADILQRKVIEFANLMSTGTRAMDSMDIGRLEKQRQGAPGGQTQRRRTGKTTPGSHRTTGRSNGNSRRQQQAQQYHSQRSTLSATSAGAWAITRRSVPVEQGRTVERREVASSERVV